MKVPLADIVQITTPSGQRFRWSSDEQRPESVPERLTHESTAPGGYATFSAQIPRGYQDALRGVDPYSHVEVLDAAKGIIWEGYIERPAVATGESSEITIDAVGYQKALEDEQGINWLGVDCDLGKWTDASPYSQEAWLRGGFRQISGPSVDTGDDATSYPSLKLSNPPAAIGARAIAIWRAPAGEGVAEVYYKFRSTTPAATILAVGVALDDKLTSSWHVSPDLIDATNKTATGTYTPPAPRPVATVDFGRIAGGTTGSVEEQVLFTILSVVGNHKLPIATAYGGYPCLYASDVIAHLVKRHASWVTVPPDGVGQTDLLIPQSADENATLPSLIDEHNKYHLWDWALWEGRTFYYHPPGQAAVHRRWKARVGPSQLEDTGADAQRIRNGVVVRFTDATGRARTVGPPGSMAEIQFKELHSSDPANLATLTGRRAYDLVEARGNMEAEVARWVGQRYLEQLNAASTSGRATVAGQVQSENGHWYPHTSVRAGDTIQFMDASDSSPRRITSVSHDHSNRTSALTLDAPPDGIPAILDRLQLSLVGLGT